MTLGDESIAATKRRVSPSTLLRWGVGLALISVGAVSLVALAQVFKNPSSWVDAGSVAQVRKQGIVFIQKPRAFVVAEGARFVALSGYSPHIADVIYYCRTSKWFEDFQAGSKFDAAGYYALGPASRGMDRYEIHIRSGRVFFDARSISQGPKRGEKSIWSNHPQGRFCAAVGALTPPPREQGFAG